MNVTQPVVCTPALKSVAVRSLATLFLSVVLTPALSQAQAGGGGGRGPGMGAMTQGPQQLQQVLGQLDLPADQKSKIDGIIKQAQKDAMAARQGLQDATPEERRQKNQDAQKIIADARTKVEAELTPEQKGKYYPLMASTGLKAVTDFVAALKTTADKAESSDDQKKQLKDLFDGDEKTLATLKTDSETVKDEETLTDFQKKMASMPLDNARQLSQVLGQDKMRTVMQDAARALRPAQGGAGNRQRGGNGAANDTVPATQPAAK